MRELSSAQASLLAAASQAWPVAARYPLVDLLRLALLTTSSSSSSDVDVAMSRRTVRAAAAAAVAVGLGPVSSNREIR